MDSSIHPLADCTSIGFILSALSSVAVDMTGVDETADAAVSKGKTKIVVIELQEQDILVGRGAPFNNYVGNVRFRALIATRKDEYNSCVGRHRIKNEIAQHVMEAVTQSGGRFLRRVESPAEAEELGIAEASKAWVIADESVAMEKIKQALRNKEGSSFQYASDHQLSTLHGSGTATMGARPAQPQVLAALLQQRMKQHKLRTALSRQKLVDMQISSMLHQPPATTFLRAAPSTSTVLPHGLSVGGFLSGHLLSTMPAMNALSRPAVLPGLSLARIAAAEEHLQMVRNQELSRHVYCSLAGTRASAQLAAPQFAPSNADSQFLDLLRLSGGTGGTMPTARSFAPNMFFGNESLQSSASSDRKRKASDEFPFVSSSSASSPGSEFESHCLCTC
jgi:hypothetical protein